jgi:hypothetical protein
VVQEGLVFAEEFCRNGNVLFSNGASCVQFLTGIAALLTFSSHIIVIAVVQQLHSCMSV